MATKAQLSAEARKRADLFIRGLESGLSTGEAARQAGAHVSAFYHRRAADLTFARRWEEALGDGAVNRKRTGQSAQPSHASVQRRLSNHLPPEERADDALRSLPIARQAGRSGVHEVVYADRAVLRARLCAAIRRAEQEMLRRCVARIEEFTIAEPPPALRIGRQVERYLMLTESGAGEEA